jgi:hypothetical protein
MPLKYRISASSPVSWPASMISGSLAGSAGTGVAGIRQMP